MSFRPNMQGLHLIQQRVWYTTMLSSIINHTRQMSKQSIQSETLHTVAINSDRDYVVIGASLKNLTHKEIQSRLIRLIGIIIIAAGVCE